MTLRRRQLEQLLLRAERSISLIERVRPLDAAVERRRLQHEWSRGREVEPRFCYAPIGGIGELRAGLEALALASASLGPWGLVYAERARELALEAELAEHVGAPRFAELAERRFPLGHGPDAEQAARWAEDWTKDPPELDAGPAVASDDERDPRSLVAVMRREVGARRLGFRVKVRRELLSAAATGDDVIVVRGGARYHEWEVRRIVEHEIVGHALPRARARKESMGLFAVGTARGSDDEEGRAVLVEQRAGHLCARRRAELGRRHLAALSVRQGADWTETVRLVRSRGASLDEALCVASRVHRGGGLAREGVYLIALSRVSRAFAADSQVERWLERGRIAVESVPLLTELGEPPELMRPLRAA